MIRIFSIYKIVFLFLMILPLSVFASLSSSNQPNTHIQSHLSIIKNLQHLNSHKISGRINQINCTGNDKTALCVAVGYIKNHKGEPTSLLMQSKDNGSNWKQVYLPKLSKGDLRHVTCMDNECTALGISNEIPVLVQTTDHGKTWTSKIIKNITFKNSNPPAGTLFVCSAKNHRCVAVCKAGESSEENTAYYSNNGGETWELAAIAGYIGFYQFNDLKCGSDGKNCVAVGWTGHNTVNPLAIRTGDAGANWFSSAHGGPCDGVPIYRDVLDSVDCDDSGLTCIAKGYCLDSSGTIRYTDNV